MATKEDLRKDLRARRQAMTTAEVDNLSELITEKLIANIDWPQITGLHIYIPIPALKEVNSWPILKYIWQEQPGIVTAIAGIGKKGQYDALKVSPATKWRGIYPQSDTRMDEQFRYDVVIVPTLGFDSRLFRLGWGGGFYDRFLAGQPEAKKIGLCFSDFEIDEIPAEPHDIKLDAVITEKRIIGKL